MADYTVPVKNGEVCVVTLREFENAVVDVVETEEYARYLYSEEEHDFTVKSITFN